MPLDLSGLTPLDTAGLKPAGGLDLSGLTPLDTTGLSAVEAAPGPEVSPDDMMARSGEGLAPPKPTVLPRPGEAEDQWSQLGSRIIENVPRVFQMAGAGVARSLVEAAPSPGGTAGMALDQDTLDDLARVQRERVDAPGGLDDWARRVAEDAASELQANAPNVDPDSLKGYAYDFAVSMAQMAPAVAATIATRSPSVGATTIGAQVFGQQYADSRAKGRSHEAAVADGTFMAAAEAIPESIPLGVLARPGKTFIARMFKGTVAEGMQEVFTQAVQDGYSAGVLDEDMTWGEALANMQRAGILGGAMGGAFAVATEPFVRGQRGADRAAALPGAMPPVPPRASDEAPEQPAAPAPRPSLLTPDDRASPLPDAVIDEGKQIIEDALAGRPLDVPGQQAENAARSGLDTAPAPTQQPATTESPGPEWRPLYSDATRAEQIGWTNPATGEARMIEMPQPAGQPVAEQVAAAPAVSDPADQAPPAAAPVKIDADLGATPAGDHLVVAEPQQDQPVAAGQQQASAPLDTTGLAPVETTPTVQTSSPDEASRPRIPGNEPRPTASWVIRNKTTGEVVMETFDRRKVDALNTEKYEAVPVQEYLGSINGAAKPAADQQAPPPEVGSALTLRKPAPRPRANPVPLLQWIRDQGGIDPADPAVGDLRATLDKAAFRLLGRPATARTGKGGRGIDYMREAAVEAGYLPEGATIADFLDAIQKDAFAQQEGQPRVVTDYDIGEAIVLEQRQRENREIDRAVTRFGSLDMAATYEGARAELLALIEDARARLAAEDAEVDRLTREGLALDPAMFEDVTDEDAIPFDFATDGTDAAAGTPAVEAPGGAVTSPASQEPEPGGSSEVRRGDRAGGDGRSGARPDAGGVEPGGVAARAEPRTERTDQGEQILVPGVQPVTDRARAEAKGAKPLRSDKAQKPADDGLFDVAGRGQADLGLSEDGPPTSTTPDPKGYVDHWQEVADLLRDIEGLDARTQAADRWVIERGQQDGLEYMAVLDGSGALIQAGTSGLVGRVDFTGATAERLDRAGSALVLTHNHPGGSSFSTVDVSQLARPGAAEVRVVTAGANYSARLVDGVAVPRPAQFIAVLERIDDMLHDREQGLIDSHAVEYDDVVRYDPHAQMLLLHRLGVINYRTGLPADSISDAYKQAIEATVPQARLYARSRIGGLHGQRHPHLPDRPAEPVRTAGGVGDVRGFDRGAAGRLRRGEDGAATDREAPDAGAADGAEREDGGPEGLSEGRQTDTPAFRRWFGDSKAVDENGEPLVVYHGTVEDIESFDPTRRGAVTQAQSARRGFFFTSDAATAGAYAESFGSRDLRRAERDVAAAERKAQRTGSAADWDRHADLVDQLEAIDAREREEGRSRRYVTGGANVVPAYLSIQNPVVVDFAGRRYEEGAFNEAIDRAQRDGHDGVIFRNAQDDPVDSGRLSDVYVAFRPEQIKSATGNRGTFDPADPNILREDAPRFDLAEAERRAVSRLTPQDRALIDQHLAPAGGGLISRLAKSALRRDFARDGIADTLITRLVNQLNPIFAYEMRAEAAAGRTPAIRDASVSAAKFAEFTMNSSGRTWAMFHVGPLRYNAAEGIVEADPAAGKGLYDIFKYLSDPATYDKFRLYAAARRGERLMSEGRERNLTPEAIARGMAMADDVGVHKGETRSFRDIFDDYQAFNAALLNGMGRDTGLLGQEEIDLWLEHADYVPFYREVDEGAIPSAAFLRRNINKPDPGIKTLEGGRQRVADLMENIARNAEAITRAGMRNVTMRRIYELAEILGEGQIVREGAAEDGVLTYRVQGREVKFTVDDPSLVAAVAAMQPEQHSGLYKALVEIASFFRNGIVASPAFMLRNLIRGTTAGFVQTGKNISLGNNVATGLTRALRNDRTIQELKAISGTGAYTFGGAGADIGAQMRRQTGAQRDLMPVAVVRKAWGALERFGEATELADRDAIYANLLKEGKTKAEAAYQAMNLINYSRRGSSKSLRVLLPLVPFLNARIQGLYRMAETQTAGPDRTKALMGVAARGLVLTGVSMVLYALQGDDDRYDDEPMHRKLAYYIVYAGDTRILIPKAFEFGAIFSTLPELLVDAVAQKEGKRLAEGLAQTLLTTFAFNPIPQPALPILENIANYNFFTGREIENDRLQNLPPGMRYNAATPRVLREIGRQFDVSPAKMENLIRGYTGTMGMSLLAGLDSIGRAAGAFPSTPTGPFGDFGIFSDALEDQIGSMVRVGPDRANRWVGDLYEMSRDVNQAYRQARQLAAEGDVEAARRLAAEEGAGARKFLNRQTRALGDINKLIRQVEDDPTMTRLAKRTELNRLNEARNRIAETAVKAVREKVPALD